MSLRNRSLSPTVILVPMVLTILALVVHGFVVRASSLSDPGRALLYSVALQVEEYYYKAPVDTKQLVVGERAGLISMLKSHKLPSNGVLNLMPNGNTEHDNSVLDAVLDHSIGVYGARVSARELTEAAIRGMLNVLHDPYTVYLTAEEMKSLDESLKGGNFGGIGVYIMQDARNGDVLVAPIDGMPASRAGLQPGEIIVAVDGRMTRTLKLDVVERLIRGKIGTSVALLVRGRQTHATTRVVRVTRELIHVPSVRAKIEDNIEYIRLADFGDTSADEVRQALVHGLQQHVRGYILDLRNNGGGYLNAAVDVSSLFIPQGTIVSTIDRNGKKETNAALGTALAVSPLVVLVNGYTASSSEITAGAIQDDHVGTLIGTKTFGKGVVQSIFPLDEGALKVTTARYVTPAGRDIQHRGIMPDIVIDQPNDPRNLDTPRDKQLAAAKAFIIRKSRR